MGCLHSSSEERTKLLGQKYRSIIDKKQYKSFNAEELKILEKTNLSVYLDYIDYLKNYYIEQNQWQIAGIFIWNITGNFIHLDRNQIKKLKQNEHMYSKYNDDLIVFNTKNTNDLKTWYG
jgi:hypothetical protein